MQTFEPGDHDPHVMSRRAILEALAGVSGRSAARVLLPVAWATPVVVLTSLPAHAECSVGFKSTQIYDSAKKTCSEKCEIVGTLASPECPLDDSSSSTSSGGGSSSTSGGGSSGGDGDVSGNKTLLVTIPSSLRARPTQVEVLKGDTVIALIASAPGLEILEVPAFLPPGAGRLTVRWVDAAGVTQRSRDVQVKP